MNKQERFVMWLLVAACFAWCASERYARRRLEQDYREAAERFVDCAINVTRYRITLEACREGN